MKAEGMGILSMKWGPYSIKAHIAENISVQGGAMHSGALCVPQADGVV